MIKSSICRERHCLYFFHKRNGRPLCNKSGRELDLPNDDYCEDEIYQLDSNFDD